MSVPHEFRGALEAGRVELVRSLWSLAFPQLPQPRSYEEAEIAMHAARTAAESISLRARAYSHRWLTERDLPSQLPDHLKPSAERLYPATAAAVGISLNTKSEIIRPALVEVRGAMEYAVLEAEADGRLEDTPFVQQRMNEAKQKTFRALFGR